VSTLIRAGSLAILITAMALVSLPVHAQDLEHVKPVFEHALPNLEGKRMVALVVSCPPQQIAGASPFAAKSTMSARRLTWPAKGSMKCAAHITGSVRMRVTASL
jgi:hypothetical protein